MSKDYLRDPEEGEAKYKSVEDYDNELKSKAELATSWRSRIAGADRAYKSWSDRFKTEMLYQYYEGFQWFFQADENNRPYVMNMIYSSIESKLPSLTFENPQFTVRARPAGLTFDEELANQKSQAKQDALNFIAARSEFGLGDKHELALLDAFFGFGVLETNYSEEVCTNPYIPLKAKPSVFDCVYAKQIPYDTFRVAANANWDLSVGKWWGYFEFVPHSRLAEYKEQLNLNPKAYSSEDDLTYTSAESGKIEVAPDANQAVGPPGTCKIWKLWDFETNKFTLYAPDDAKTIGDAILEYSDFDFCPLSILRFGKRRKGWYPYPPVWNWISPQDEINDTRQTQRIHRKRFSRKYLANPGKFESEEELDKFLYGPDGTVIKVNSLNDAVKPVEDAPLDPVDSQTLVLAYDDFNRASGTPDEYRGMQVSSNRTTATQAGIIDRRSQVREAKDSVRVADFLCDIGKHILKALRKTKKPFWVRAKLDNETFLGEVKTVSHGWKTIPAQLLRDEDYDIDLNVTSVSPISAQTDKQAFMEFLALLTQYEILAFSPALIREAAYRTGYKNEAVLNQFQQWAQLAALGRQAQLQNQSGGGGAAGGGGGGVQPNIGGPQMAQQQIDQSMPPDNQQIMNQIFNRSNQ